MKSHEFNVLIDRINNWSDVCYDGEPLIINDEGLSTLTHLQWKKLHETLKLNQVSSFGIYNGNTKNFSGLVWQALFHTLKESNVTEFINKESIYEYDSPQWKIFFSEMKKSPIRKLGFHFSKLHKMSKENMIQFFKELSTSIVEQFDISYHSFGDASKETCELFFDNLTTCSNIKRLLLNGDFTLGASENEFWNICATKISKSSIEYLGLDGTRLFRISESSWLDFCKGLSKSPVTSLSLCDNLFYHFETTQWEWFFQGLALTPIKELDLREHHSLKLKEDKWETFCNGLQGTIITTLHYERNQFDEKQKEIIGQILKENQKKLTIARSEDGIQKEEVNFQTKTKPVLMMYNSTIKAQNQHKLSKKQQDGSETILQNQEFEFNNGENKENTKPTLKVYELRKRKTQEENTKYVSERNIKGTQTEKQRKIKRNKVLY